MNEERRRLELPDRRQTTYDELANRLDAHIADIQQRLRRFFTRALAAFAIIGLTSAIALLGFGIVLRKVQQQRYDFCISQNDRRSDTTTALIQAAKDDESERKTEAGKAEVRRRRDVTLKLIDALVPHQDCSKIAPEGKVLP